MDRKKAGTGGGTHLRRRHARRGLVRPCLAMLSLVGLLLLGSCAALGTVPGVSMLVDLLEVQSMMKRLESGELTKAELSDMAGRPMPSPPGLSFEVAALRRMAGKMALGDYAGVAEVRELLRQHGREPELQLMALSASALAFQLEGRYQSALAEFQQYERAAKAQRKTAGPALLRNELDVFTFALFLDAAMQAGQYQEVDRVLAEFFAGAQSDTTTSPAVHREITHVAQRMRARLLVARGNAVQGLAMARQLLGEQRRRFAAERLWASAADQSLASASIWSTSRVVSTAAVSANQLGAAAAMLEDMVQLSAEARPSATRAMELAWQRSTTLGAMGDYRGALIAMDEALAKAPIIVQKSRAPRMAMEGARAMALVGAGQAAEAARRLQTFYRAGMHRGSELERMVVIGLTLSSALAGGEPQALADFDGIAPLLAGEVASERAFIYFGSRAVVYRHRAALASGAAAEVHWRSALEAGRTFARALRGIRATGVGRELGIAAPLVPRAKEAYLLAAATMHARGLANDDDLLDATTLAQESDLDDDIAAAASRARRPQGVTDDAWRRLQDAQLAARAAQTALTELGRSSDASAQQMAAAVQAAYRSSQAVEEQLQAIRRVAPAASLSLAPEPVRAAALRSALRPQEALLVVTPVAEGTLVVWVGAQGVQQRLVSMSTAQTVELVRRIRASVALADGQRPPAFALSDARALHDNLLGWIGASLRNTKSLNIVATGPLAAIPFALLVQGPVSTAIGIADYRQVPWMIRAASVAHAPSLPAWLASSRQSVKAPGRSFLAWADPDFGDGAPGESPELAGTRSWRSLSRLHAPDLSATVPAQILQGRLARLPETLDEAATIAGTLRASRSADVISGERATRSSVIALSESGDLATRAVVMFATHGLAPGDVLGLRQPALVLAREVGQSQPSLLLLEDVLGLRMNADWVLLSACDTSSAERIGGDPLSGLARGFLFAGARALLVTHWRVETHSAKEMTTTMMERYAAQPGLTRAQALQQAALDLIDARRTKPEWAHPAYWAAFAVLGDERRQGATEVGSPPARQGTQPAAPRQQPGQRKERPSGGAQPNAKPR